jgi:hypothetical protein
VDKTLLVGPDIDKGSKILEILDAAGLRVSVALWAFLADYEAWRIVLSSRKFDSAGPIGGYGLLHDALDAGGLSLEETPPVGIFRNTDPFIRALRKDYGNAPIGMRVRAQLLGDRFVEDAYIYRVS